MKLKELVAVVVLFYGILLALAVIRAVTWTAEHWVPLVLLAAALLAFGLLLWHRRMMAYHREQWATGEGWRKIWCTRAGDIYACPACRALVSGWSDMEAHFDPLKSACAAFVLHLEAAQADPEAVVRAHGAGPGKGWPATFEPEQAEVGSVNGAGE